MTYRAEDIPLDDLGKADDVIEDDIYDDDDDDIIDDDDYTYDDIYEDDDAEGDAAKGDIAETSFSIGRLPDAPLHNPSAIAGDNISNLRERLNHIKLAAVKKNLVKNCYKSIYNDYRLPLPKKIPYKEFKISKTGKTLFWTPENEKFISLINKKVGGFLALSTLTSRYGKGGITAIKNSLGLKDYTSKTRKVGELSDNTQKQVQHARDTLPPENVEITPVVIDQAFKSSGIATEALDEELTPEQSAALGTIDDPPLDLQSSA
ncbi:hypothetical protein RRG08_063252 [Elysia crispata]|uniref:Uncharacterized protein n=1 Tax=Elysia crispata TaxID=231223 RepID=A0AAE1CK68_9GAST|nr:hypothetical protein RRG08_063252 [Elysia crispata]